MTMAARTTGPGCFATQALSDVAACIRRRLPGPQSYIKYKPLGQLAEALGCCSTYFWGPGHQVVQKVPIASYSGLGAQRTVPTWASKS